MLMKKSQFLATTKACLLAVASSGLLLTSCASDGFEDETFDSGVNNTQIQNLTEDQITITPSADESKTIIKWKVVNGASGYDCKVYNTTSGSNVVVLDSLVDGCEFMVNRDEDCYYLLTIQPKGDTARGNSDAAQMTSKKFNSFSETFATIPDGTDLAAYFEANPVSTTPAGKELCYDLEPGGNYTLTGNVNFGGQRITLRSTQRSNPANLTIGEDACFITFNGMAMKYLNINAAAANKSIVSLTDSPNDSIKSKESSSYYVVTVPFVFKGCTISSLATSILATNSTKYNIRNLVVNDCVIQLDETAATANTGAIVYIKSGYITESAYKNSTIYAKDHIEKFFIQHGGRPKDISEAETRTVSIENCTLANLAWNKNFCDYHNGQTTYTYVLQNCIIQDCGKANLVTGLNKGQDSDNPTWNINNNTYWRGNADASEKQLGDNGSPLWMKNNKGSNTVLTTDPAIDPATGKFTPASAQQAAKQGDPRWYSAQ